MAAPNILSATSIYGKTVGAALNTDLNNALLANAGSSNKVFKINSIIVANVDGSSSCDVSVEYYDGSTAYRLASTVAVPAVCTLVILGKDSPIYLEEGCSIRGGASAGSDLEIVITYDELDDA